jgi:hypothetical protein
MTHQECANDIALNYDVLGREYKGTKIAALAIIEDSVADIETEIKKILQKPEVPAESVIGRDYSIYAVFNKYEFMPNEKVDFLYIKESLSDLELEELFFF